MKQRCLDHAWMLAILVSKVLIAREDAPSDASHVVHRWKVDYVGLNDGASCVRSNLYVCVQELIVLDVLELELIVRKGLLVHGDLYDELFRFWQRYAQIDRLDDQELDGGYRASNVLHAVLIRYVAARHLDNVQAAGDCCQVVNRLGPHPNFDIDAVHEGHLGDQI